MKAYLTQIEEFFHDNGEIQQGQAEFTAQFELEPPKKCLIGFYENKKTKTMLPSGLLPHELKFIAEFIEKAAERKINMRVASKEEF